MFKLKNYTWAFLLTTAIIVIVSSNVDCTGKASTKIKDVNNNPEFLKTAGNNDNNNVVILTDQTFDAQIKKGVVLVDFWATWCRPCRIQGPIIDEIGAELSQKAVVGKLDVDQNPVIASRYGVQSIPTMIIFNNGKVVGRFLGVTSKEQILMELNKYIK